MRASQAFNAGSIPVTRSKFSTQSMLRGSNPGGPEAVKQSCELFDNDGRRLTALAQTAAAVSGEAGNRAASGSAAHSRYPLQIFHTINAEGIELGRAGGGRIYIVDTASVRV